MTPLPEQNLRPDVEEYGGTYVRIEKKDAMSFGELRAREMRKVFVETPLEGLPAEEAWYDPSGKLLERVVYRWDDKRNLLNATWYNQDNEVFGKDEYEYGGEDGKKLMSKRSARGPGERTWDGA